MSQSRRAHDNRARRGRQRGGPPGFDIEVEGVDTMHDFATLIAEQGDDGKVLKKELSKGLRDSMKPMLKDARSNAKSIPARGNRSTGLRASLAKATKLKVSMSKRNPQVRMFVDYKKLPFSSAANVMDGQRPWRHPVFGDTEVWVDQKPHPFFTSAVKHHLGDVRRKITDVLEGVGNKILEAGK